ncbi:hypothetical protein [Streptococcus orisasini]
MIWCKIDRKDYSREAKERNEKGQNLIGDGLMQRANGLVLFAGLF